MLERRLVPHACRLMKEGLHNVSDVVTREADHLEISLSDLARRTICPLVKYVAQYHIHREGVLLGE